MSRGVCEDGGVTDLSVDQLADEILACTNDNGLCPVCRDSVAEMVRRADEAALERDGLYAVNAGLVAAHAAAEARADEYRDALKEIASLSPFAYPEDGSASLAPAIARAVLSRGDDQDGPHMVECPGCPACDARALAVLDTNKEDA
jgi:hypothetical protein